VETAQDPVQWCAFVLSDLNLQLIRKFHMERIPMYVHKQEVYQDIKPKGYIKHPDQLLFQTSLLNKEAKANIVSH
jgi:hypothetical protein